MTMTIVLTSIAFAISAVCAGVMGFAIQRGATCTVAAVDEVVSKRRFQRLISIIEASLWVVGGLLIAQALHLLGIMPGGYAIGWLTVLGGILLGVGAFVNRACVFGAIARLGSGEWSYIATPIGFYAGCVSLTYLYTTPAHPKLPYGSPVLEAPVWVAALFVGLMLVRVIWGLRAGSDDQTKRGWWSRVKHAFTKRIWSPHAATTVIGIAFFFMLLLVGAWAYTDVLAELAQGNVAQPHRAAPAAARVVCGRDAGWLDGRQVPSRPHHLRAIVEVLRRRGLDGVGQSADSRRQRRPHPGGITPAVAVRVARILYHVRLDRYRAGHAKSLDRAGFGERADLGTLNSAALPANRSRDTQSLARVSKSAVQEMFVWVFPCTENE